MCARIAGAHAERAAGDLLGMPGGAERDGLALAARGTWFALRVWVDDAGALLAASLASKTERGAVRHAHVAEVAVRDAFDQAVFRAMTAADGFAMDVVLSCGDGLACRRKLTVLIAM